MLPPDTSGSSPTALTQGRRGRRRRNRDSGGCFRRFGGRGHLRGNSLGLRRRARLDSRHRRPVDLRDRRFGRRRAFRGALVRLRRSHARVGRRNRKRTRMHRRFAALRRDGLRAPQRFEVRAQLRDAAVELEDANGEACEQASGDGARQSGPGRAEQDTDDQTDNWQLPQPRDVDGGTLTALRPRDTSP